MSSSGPELDKETEDTGLPAIPTWRGVYVFVAVFFTAVLALLILLERAFA